MCLGIFVDFLVIGFRNMFALCLERSSEIERSHFHQG